MSNVRLIKDIDKVRRLQGRGFSLFNFEEFIDQLGHVYGEKGNEVKVQYFVNKETIHYIIHRDALEEINDRSLTMNTNREEKNDRPFISTPNDVILENRSSTSNSSVKCEKQLKDLMAAIKDDSVTDISHLCKNNIHINDRNLVNQNALHWASHNGNVKKMDTLISHGIDVTLQDNDGDTVLCAAIYGGQLGAVEYLCKKYPFLLKEVNKKNETPLILAARKNETNIFKALLKLSPDIINDQDACGDTALHYIAKKNNVVLLNHMLLSKEVLLNQINAQGYSPFLVACLFGHEGIIEGIMNYCKKRKSYETLNQLTSKKRSGHQILIQEKHFEVAKMLIEKYPRKWSKDPLNPSMGTILHCAVHYMAPEIVKSLLKADPDLKEKIIEHGKSALDIALELYSRTSDRNEKEARNMVAVLYNNGVRMCRSANNKILQKIIHM